MRSRGVALQRQARTSIRAVREFPELRVGTVWSNFPHWWRLNRCRLQSFPEYWIRCVRRLGFVNQGRESGEQLNGQLGHAFLDR